MTTQSRTCLEPNILANQTYAQKIYGDNALFSLVDVLITKRNVNANTITFLAMNAKPGHPGEPGGLGEYTVEWGKKEVMWAPCSSTLQSNATHDNPGDPPLEDSIGSLWFHIDFLKQKTNLLYDIPKWPRSLGAEPPPAHGPQAAPLVQEFYETLEVWPSSVVVSGVELKNGRHYEGSVDLLNRRLAKPGQTIQADRKAPMKLELTPYGFKQFNTHFDGFKHLKRALQLLREPGNADQPTDPFFLAEALRVIAACVEDSGSALPEQRKLLQSFVPGLAP